MDVGRKDEKSRQSMYIMYIVSVSVGVINVYVICLCFVCVYVFQDHPMGQWTFQISIGHPLDGPGTYYTQDIIPADSRVC